MVGETYWTGQEEGDDFETDTKSTCSVCMSRLAQLNRYQPTDTRALTVLTEKSYI